MRRGSRPSNARVLRAQMDAQVRSTQQRLRKRGLQLGVVKGHGEEKYFVAWDSKGDVVDDAGTRKILRDLREATGCPTGPYAAHPGAGYIDTEASAQREGSAGGSGRVRDAR